MMDAIIALVEVRALFRIAGIVPRYAHNIPIPSRATNPSFTRSFRFRFQNIHVENTARYRSVAELKAVRENDQSVICKLVDGIVLTPLKITVVSLDMYIPTFRLSSLIPNGRCLPWALHKYYNDKDTVDDNLETCQNP
jgi:hypothetical protein